MPDFMNPAAAPGDPGFGGTFAATLTPDPSNTGDPDTDTQSFFVVDTARNEDDVFSPLTCTLWEGTASLGPYAVAITYNDAGAAVLTASALPLPLPAPFAPSGAAYDILGTVNGLPYRYSGAATITDGTATTDPATTTDPAADPNTGGGAQDISLALSAPLTSLLPPARVLMAQDQPGSFVHVLVSLTANDGGSAGDSFASSLTNTPPRLALVRGYAEDSDFQDGTWLEQTGEDAPLTYARLDAAGLPQPLVSGCAYFVYVQVTAGGQTITRRAPGEIIVC